MTEPSKIPDGYYAVPDPTNPDQLTLWHVIGDRIDASPPNVRYGPILLKHDVPPGRGTLDRQEWIRDWFDTVRLPWTQAVRAAIAADPDAAGALYATAAIRCRDCGRPLKDPTSKAAGRGPDCRAQLAQLLTTATRPDTTTGP